MTTKRENVPYTAFPGTVLIGVPVSRCSNCGEYEVAIPAIDELNRVLAGARSDQWVITDPGNVAAVENTTA